MQICQNCGNRNPDGARFCKKCGDSLVMQTQQRRTSGGNQRSGQQNRRPAQQRSGQQNRRPVQQKSRGNRGGRRSRRESSNTGLTVVMCLVGALVAVLIIGAAILIAMHLAG